ncbi:hypothetical protein SAMN05444287_0027 [Octadecabacter temperatus]|uniref:Uncharacterized protein n=1 Tax=Octadecabacter temperatus TaxID=1458307 RepID=A0A0K0Y207_9RHOB|nr:hypothetical protein [Octadecabacter temperatus]AKS44942.1 hypothetical protein OSB_03760 [Octadecabacter temperatus]SIN83124.1 hypothetical protein SAMN05444287_0027 [Octadecabacter temperatus]
MIQVSKPLCMTFLASLLLTPIGAIAQSSCPTAAMLDGDGIRFDQDNGDYEIHSMASNGAVQQTTFYDGDESLNYVVHGIHVLQLSSIENGRVIPDSLWQFVFEMPIADMPAPIAGGSWSARTTQIQMGETQVENVRHRWGALTSVQFGNCTLDAIPVTAKYTNSDYNHTEEMLYFPDLETAILTAYSDPDGRDDYTFVSVRAE